MMLDENGRKIDSLRVSVTDRCNLRCGYCMPRGKSVEPEDEGVLGMEEMEELVRAFVDLGVAKVRIAGGDPLVRSGVVELVKALDALPDLEQIALTTNGQLLAPMARELAEAGLDRVDIRIDSLDPAKYQEMSGGGSLVNVLRGIREARKAGLGPVKLNVVLIGGLNEEEIEDFVDLTREYVMDVRFIELVPVGEATGWPGDRFLSNSVVLERVPSLVPVEDRFLDPASPASYYRLPDGQGRVGLIDPTRSDRVRLTARGHLELLHHADGGLDLGSLLRSMTASGVAPAERSRRLQEAIQAQLVRGDGSYVPVSSHWSGWSGKSAAKGEDWCG
ncbi:GTP 3',8-cyclase MoaA [Anaerotalea alkaliphila]|nr:radical SAM protein [Anaerotalea alkaliphila]